MQQRAFTCAGCAAQSQEIAAPQFNIHAAQNLERALAEDVGLVETFCGEKRFSHIKLQIPSSKLRRSAKSQAPKVRSAPLFGTWCLGFLWSLEPGTWGFCFYSYLSASTGLSLPARQAGITPPRMHTIKALPQMIRMSRGIIRAGSFVNS